MGLVVLLSLEGSLDSSRSFLDSGLHGRDITYTISEFCDQSFDQV